VVPPVPVGGGGSRSRRERLLERPRPRGGVTALRSNDDVTVADVVVVGAGITGLSIAFHLAALGVERVLVLDRSGVGAEASGVQPGGVRRQWGTRTNCLLASESFAFYRDIGARLDVDDPPVLEECGYFFVADTAATLGLLQADVTLQRELGIPAQILTPDEIADLVPGFVADGVAGASYCAEDGYFDRPQGVVEAFAQAAGRRGVAIEHGEVRTLEHDGVGWTLALADGRRCHGERVVVAAGTGTPQLIQSVAGAVPITPEPKYLFYSDPIKERLLEPLVVLVDRHFAAKQLASGRVLASDLAASGPVDDHRREWRRHVRECIDAVVPQLTYVSFGIFVEGFYDMTPDHQPIVGAVAGDGTLWVSAGFSGHGFMIAPAIGRIVSEALVDGLRDQVLDDLALARFERESIETEARIV
jgi:sarcosine oxidase subunit beta